MDSVIQSSVLALFSVSGLLSIVSVLSAYWVYRWALEPFNYWKKRGIPQVKVKYPLIGNCLVSLQKPAQEVSSAIYNEFPEQRFVGFYSMQSPSLMVRDPNLVEAVLIKDFSVFSDRVGMDPSVGNMSKHLLNLKEEHWKNMRNKLAPTFTSGKLKRMHSQLIDCASSLMKYMKNLEDSPFEVRDVISRFTMDVIASCAFGLNTDTINDPESEFRQMGLAIFKPTLLRKVLFSLRFLPEWAVHLIGKMIDTSGGNKKRRPDFFENVVNTTVEYRKQNNVTRPDFLHLINELKEKDEEIVRNREIDADSPFLFDHNSLLSNAFVFFIAGFETTGTTLSFAVYELAVNPDIQNRACEEVMEVTKGGQPDYEACQKMKYLEMVISETLRKYPPVHEIKRKAGADYRIPGTDTVLPKGTIITVPIHAIHHDPQCYPDPEKFRPERFDEEKDAVGKGTYLPFGGGPRVCIGARFAKLEAKVCLATILQNYEIFKCDKTRIPLKIDKNALLLAPEGGIWITVKPRGKTNYRQTRNP